MDIMHSIYSMMGKHTYPSLKDAAKDAPKEHVDSFFQVNNYLINLFNYFTIIIQNWRISGG